MLPILDPYTGEPLCETIAPSQMMRVDNYVRAGHSPNIEYLFFSNADPMAPERIKRFVADHKTQRGPIAIFRVCAGVSLPLVGSTRRFSAV